MSVIGPRPGLWNQDVLTAERDKYNANDVKPGLSGWAQINKCVIPQYKALKNVFVNESEDNTKYAEILKELRVHIMVSNMYVDKKKRKTS